MLLSTDITNAAFSRFSGFSLNNFIEISQHIATKSTNILLLFQFSCH